MQGCVYVGVCICVCVQCSNTMQNSLFPATHYKIKQKYILHIFTTTRVVYIISYFTYNKHTYIIFTNYIHIYTHVQYVGGMFEK